MIQYTVERASHGYKEMGLVHCAVHMALVHQLFQGATINIWFSKIFMGWVRLVYLMT